MLDKKNIIAQMIRPDWDGELEENRDKEKFLIQILRNTQDTAEVLEICEAIGQKGSLFATPVLMAKMLTASDQMQRSYFIATMAIIMSRMQGWESGSENDFFNPKWWQIKWVASKERFISFISILAGTGNESLFDDQKMEELAELFIPEMDVDLSPYQSFKELRLLTPDWDLARDITLISEAIAEDQLMVPIFDENPILKHDNTQISDNILDMRVDYLVTKLGLYQDFGHYHYLLRMALVLNRP